MKRPEVGKQRKQYTAGQCLHKASSTSYVQVDLKDFH